MARFVKLASGTGVRLYRSNVPLYYLRDSLIGRLWNRFSETPGFLKAINFLLTFALLVPVKDLIFKDHDNKRFHCAVWE